MKVLQRKLFAGGQHSSLSTKSKKPHITHAAWTALDLYTHTHRTAPVQLGICPKA